MGRQLNISKKSTRGDTNFRYKMDPLMTKIEGRGNGIKTILLNVRDIGVEMRTDPKYITKFLGIEQGAQSTWNEKRGVGIVNGAHQTQDLQDLVFSFIEEFILCPCCELPELKHIVKKNATGGKCFSCGWVGSLSRTSTHAIFKYISKNPPKKEDKSTSKTQSKGKRRRRVRGGDGTNNQSPGQEKKKVAAKNNENVYEQWHSDDTLMETREMRQLEQQEIERLRANTSKEAPDTPVALLKFALKQPNKDLVVLVSELQRIKIAHKLDEAETKLGKVLVDAIFDFATFQTFYDSIQDNADLLSWYAADRETAKILISYIEEAIVEKDYWEYTPMVLEKFYDENVFDEEFLLHWYNQPPENSYVVQDPEDILKIKAKSEPFIDWIQEVWTPPKVEATETIEETVEIETDLDENESAL